jgi:hypothetical protein
VSENISQLHPDYVDRISEWSLMRDTIRGTTAVKEAGEDYLPMPSGFAAQQSAVKTNMYDAYRMRAEFPEIVQPAVQAMVGVIHQTEIKIDLPEAMMPIWERATKDGLPLEAFHRRITAEILQSGRYAILADASEEGAMPFLSGFRAEALLNWDEINRTMFVLDESGLKREGFDWVYHNQYLALLLEDGRYVGRRYDAGGDLVGDELQPTTAKSDSLDAIPLVVVGPRDLSLKPETPPMIAIARAAIKMYQLSADYYWQLFMSGQETLFVLNAEAPNAVGAGVSHSLKPIEPSQDVDAKYVGPAGTGISAHRVAIQDAQEAAANAGARLFNSGAKAAESGDALRIRYTAETASLISIASASCSALEAALRFVAVMMGLDPNEVVVTKPKSLVDQLMTPEEMTALMGLADGGKISDETLYEQLQAGNRANPERDWAQEQKLIEKEHASDMQDALDASTPQLDPAQDPSQTDPAVTQQQPQGGPTNA